MARFLDAILHSEGSAKAAPRARKRLVWVDTTAGWLERFTGVAERYAEFDGPGFYDRATGDCWGGFPRADDSVMLGNEQIYSPMIIKDVPEFFEQGYGYVSSRSTKREMMKDMGGKTETVIRDWERVTPAAKGRPRKGYINKKVCDASGAKFSEGDLDWVESKCAEQMAPMSPEHRNLKFPDQLESDYDH